jgi:(p)ppGpp synthase/HD superfamily hydrolase
MSDKVSSAKNFAIEKHGNQLYGDKPYIYHLNMVYEIVLKINLDEDYQIAAYLHDCLEDTNTTKKELESKFGKRVSDMVYSVTGEGDSRVEKKNSMLKKLEKFPEGINLKMADRLANMLQCKSDGSRKLEMYIKEMPSYMGLFSKGNEELLIDLISLTKVKKFKP